jgi:hypothetical protein
VPGAADGAHLDRHRLAAVVLDVDDRADADLVAGSASSTISRVSRRDARADARLEQALLVLRGVVLEVLRQVAELARLLDRGDDLGCAAAPRAPRARRAARRPASR